MKHLFTILTLAAALSIGQQNIAAQDIYSNDAAPAGYDANLRPGAYAIAVLMGDLERVKIVSKSGGVYKTLREDREYEFRSNAIYPDFDPAEFGEIVSYGYGVIDAYLPCYARKHGREQERVTGNGFNPSYTVDISSLKTDLEANQGKLAEISARVKRLANRPDTFLPYDKNPAIWDDIATNRAEYLRCALGERQESDVKDSPWLRAHRDGIAKVLKQVNDYDPATMNSMGSGSEYALYAVSPRERAKWLKDKNALAFAEEIDKLLKPLADALAKKLPTYKPRTSIYSVRNAGEEALMMRVLTVPSRYTVFSIGLAHSAWQIDKGVLGIPQARYKNGLIYLRDKQADHPYCYATYVNVIQDYAGGGTYASSRAEIRLDELAACPAGK